MSFYRTRLRTEICIFGWVYKSRRRFRAHGKPARIFWELKRNA